MKKIFLFFTALASTFIFCSCTTVTEDLGDAYANMDIKFHNKDYMEDQELHVPHGVNEERFEKREICFYLEPGDEERIKKFSSITKEDIIRVSKKVSLHTILTLENKEEDHEEN